MSHSRRCLSCKSLFCDSHHSETQSRLLLSPGIVAVAALAARTAGSPPVAANTATWLRTSSAKHRPLTGVLPGEGNARSRERHRNPARPPASRPGTCTMDRNLRIHREGDSGRFWTVSTRARGGGHGVTMLGFSRQGRRARSQSGDDAACAVIPNGTKVPRTGHINISRRRGSAVSSRMTRSM